jgi:23S rRNA pseudouridine1911/1915/1917 synthase
MRGNNTSWQSKASPPVPLSNLERGNRGPGGKGGEADRILFEDNHLLIVNKLPGEIVQGDKTGDEPMAESLKSYIKVKYNKPGEVFLGVVHRLDRPVSGAVIFARTSKALARMNAMLQKREVRKVYWAIVAGQRSAVSSQRSAVSGQEWFSLTHYLKKNEQQNKSYVFDHPGEGMQKAELKYRKIASGERYDLLEVELLTGRHHQIRAQLAAIGSPIKGDLKYGSPRSNPDGSISLHARLVEFVHPVSGLVVSVTAPVPEEKLWKTLTANIST